MKPSEIVILKAKKTWMLLPSFKAITWMGTVYCRKQNDVDAINKSIKIDSSFKCHEMIHVKQAQSTKDSWTRFYLKYVWNWIKNIPLIFINIHAPYKLIPFEIEAYLNQDNWTYVENKLPCYQWMKFERLSYKEKKYIAKEYYKRNVNKKTYSSILYDILGNPS